MCVSESRPQEILHTHAFFRTPPSTMRARLAGGWVTTWSIWETALLSQLGPATDLPTDCRHWTSPAKISWFWLRSAELPGWTTDLGAKLIFYFCMPVRCCGWLLHRITVAIDNGYNLLGIAPMKVSLKFVWGAWFRTKWRDAYRDGYSSHHSLRML